ncbi:MAG: alpha/beta hydrolase [Myxococcaceae bacterium]|nr:MAG: alpha/beta hydrolase [Myxococcaceae bacterium]
MRRWVTAVRLTLGYLATLLAAAARRPFRAPARPSWSIGDEARATFLRRFLHRLHAMPVEAARPELDSVPVLVPGALLRTRRRRGALSGVPVTWVTPRAGAEPRLVLYVHGGGFTLGSSRTVRDLLSRLALASNARVLSVDYRLAPEHPWPAGLEDVRAVWTAALAEQGPSQIVLAGDSAGGNLVLSLLLELRDRREALPAGAVLLSPWVDLACTAASFQANADVDVLERDALLREASRYAGGGDPGQPSLSPLRADLAGLPPLYLQAGEAELFRDDVMAFVARARAAGVSATLDVFDDQVHDFQAFGALSRISVEAIARVGEAVQVFAPVPKMAARG